MADPRKQDVVQAQLDRLTRVVARMQNLQRDTEAVKTVLSPACVTELKFSAEVMDLARSIEGLAGEVREITLEAEARRNELQSAQGLHTPVVMIMTGDETSSQ